MTKINLDFRLVSDKSIGFFDGYDEWESSNVKIIQEHGGNHRSGYSCMYKVFHGGKLIKEIPFSFDSSLKSQLAKIDLDDFE